MAVSDLSRRQGYDNFYQLIYYLDFFYKKELWAESQLWAKFSYIRLRKESIKDKLLAHTGHDFRVIWSRCRNLQQTLPALYRYFWWLNIKDIYMPGNGKEWRRRLCGRFSHWESKSWHGKSKKNLSASSYSPYQCSDAGFTILTHHPFFLINKSSISGIFTWTNTAKWPEKL